MQFMVLRDLAVGLLDVLDHVEDLAQNAIEGGDRIARWWLGGGRTGPFTKEREVVLNRAYAGLSPADSGG